MNNSVYFLAFPGNLGVSELYSFIQFDLIPSCIIVNQQNVFLEVRRDVGFLNTKSELEISSNYPSIIVVRFEWCCNCISLAANI